MSLGFIFNKFVNHAKIIDVSGLERAQWAEVYTLHAGDLNFIPGITWSIENHMVP